MAGIYIHIPFCRKACHYCNFHFSTSLQLLPKMMDAIGKEAVLRRSYLAEAVETVYFGGGTPSLLETAELEKIMLRLRNEYDILPTAEITLETNPDDISAAALHGWKKAGINRLSIGIQSFFEEDLQWMNRAHNAVQALAAIQLAQNEGFSNITVDLIYGSPALTDAKWEKNVQQALALNIPHLSCYALTVEPKTALAKMIESERTEDVNTDQQAKQFGLLTEWLSAAGYEHYEISNFARPGFRSRHNSSYWQGRPYLGLGPSAHSFNGHSRQWNIASNALYISSIESGMIPFEQEILTEVQQYNEYIMTALRTLEGISLDRVAAQWGKEAVELLQSATEKHIVAGQLAAGPGRLFLTPAGKFLADGIAADLFQEEVR